MISPEVPGDPLMLGAAGLESRSLELNRVGSDFVPSQRHSDCWMMFVVSIGRLHRSGRIIFPHFHCCYVEEHDVPPV